MGVNSEGGLSSEVGVGSKLGEVAYAFLAAAVRGDAKDRGGCGRDSMASFCSKLLKASFLTFGAACGLRLESTADALADALADADGECAEVGVKSELGTEADTGLATEVDAESRGREGGGTDGEGCGLGDNPFVEVRSIDLETEMGLLVPRSIGRRAEISEQS